MNKQAVIKVKVVRKPSLSATLKSLPLGEPQRFSTRDFKIQSAKNEIKILRGKGYDFTITERGCVNEYIVTCLKNNTK